MLRRIGRTARRRATRAGPWNLGALALLLASPAPGQAAAPPPGAGGTAAPTLRALTFPPRAVDHAPDPDVFETVITAAPFEAEFVPGRRTPAMAFNGSIPGPTINAKLGDRLIVHFVNMLPQETSLHWHGVAVPATMDGSGLSHVPVPRSGYRRYEFTLNVAGTFWYHPHVRTNEQAEAGLYGALIVRDPAQEEPLGVAPEQERVVFLDDVLLDQEHRIAPFAADMAADLEPWARAEELANSRPGNHVLVNGRAWAGYGLPRLRGIEGRPIRLRLINAASGRIFRLDLVAGLRAVGDVVGSKIGGVENPSGSASRLWAIGSDQGLWNEAEAVRPIDQVRNDLGHHDELISNPDPRAGITLTPGDRMDVVVVPSREDGDAALLRSHDFQRGKHTAYTDPEGRLLFGHDHFDGAEPPEPLLAVEILPGDGAPSWTPPAPLRHDPIAPLPLAADARTPERTIPVFFGHSEADPDTGNVMFFLEVARSRELLADVLAKKPVLPVDYDPLPMPKLDADDGHEVGLGSIRVLTVVNFTGNDHNLHLHGFRFQHLGTDLVDLDGFIGDEPIPSRGTAVRHVEPLRLAYEDTIRIPKRAGETLGRSWSITHLAVRFDDRDLPEPLRRSRSELLAEGLSPGASTSGGWLLHCHFLEHSAKGMQTFVQVVR